MKTSRANKILPTARKQLPEYLPVFFSGYAQDESEWNQLTFRVGARFDWFDARTTLPSDLANPANSIPDVPQSTPVATTNTLNVSPRVGLSYPVAPNAALYFSYGQKLDFYLATSAEANVSKIFLSGGTAKVAALHRAI